MRLNITKWIVVTVLTLTVFCGFTTEDKNQLSDRKNSIDSKLDRSARSSLKFGFKSKKKAHDLSNSPGLFPAIISILGGSVMDTFVAYRNLSRLIQTAFPQPRPGDTNTTFTLNQGVQLFGRNFRGLRRVFDKEFVRALNESDKNVMDFGKELKDSIRPFLQPNRNLTSF